MHPFELLSVNSLFRRRPVLISSAPQSGYPSLGDAQLLSLQPGPTTAVPLPRWYLRVENRGVGGNQSYPMVSNQNEALIPSFSMANQVRRTSERLQSLSRMARSDFRATLAEAFGAGERERR